MGLRCLMGHDYGALQTEQEREDRGEEAVVTVREFKECGRCGHRQIVSENKEVTSTTTEPEDDPSGSESEFRREPEIDPEPEFGPEPDDEYDDVTAEEDDGVILDDSATEDERDPGDWPDAPDEDVDAETDDEEDESGHDPWPEVEGEDEGYDAEPADGGPTEDVDFGGGIAPETETQTASAGVVEDAGDGSAPAGIRSVEPAGGQRTVGVDTSVVCPECEHTAPASGSSLRPGDICPECRRGYLVERES